MDLNTEVDNLVKASQAWIPMIMEYGSRVLLAVITLAIGWWLINKVTQKLGGLLALRNADLALQGFISSLANIILKVLLIVSVASMIGVETTSFVAAMLTHTNESAVGEFAGALHAAAPSDVVLTEIHALALHQQGKAEEAKALVGKLAAAALKESRSALYHGVFLAASNHPAEAGESFELDGIRTLLIEERALIGKARTAAQSGPEKPGGK